jgi:hypothetical protein
MKSDELLKLADLLESDARSRKGIKFDLSVVIRRSDKRRPTWSCGTAACALGLWGISNQFEGVLLEEHDRGSWWPNYKGQIGRDAAEAYFEIDKRTSAWLFLPHFYDGAKTGRRGELAVAKRIRRFVAGEISPQS